MLWMSLVIIKSLKIKIYLNVQGSKFIFGFGSTCATKCKFVLHRSGDQV